MRWRGPAVLVGRVSLASTVAGDGGERKRSGRRIRVCILFVPRGGGKREPGETRGLGAIYRKQGGRRFRPAVPWNLDGDLRRGGRGAVGTGGDGETWETRKGQGGRGTGIPGKPVEPGKSRGPVKPMQAPVPGRVLIRKIERNLQRILLFSLGLGTLTTSTRKRPSLSLHNLWGMPAGLSMSMSRSTRSRSPPISTVPSPSST